MHENSIKVWDLLVRIGHWTLVAAFATAYITEGEVMPTHAIAGYTIASVVLVRIVWGFVGTKHARFSDFVRGPRATIGYLRSIVAGRSERHIGHNPAGGAMILLLLAALAGTVTCGMVLYGIEEGAGPLAGWVAGANLDEDVWEEAHELFANGTLLLIALHVAGVIHASRAHGENLVKAMFTGRKQVSGDQAD
jgi:cytochrome b